MRRSQRGFTLIEMIVSMGLSLIVLSVGYGAYYSFSRADDVERTREQLNLTAQNAMGRIKEDVRSANLVRAFEDTLVLNTTESRIDYTSRPHGTGVKRMSRHGCCLFKGVSARFTESGRGVNVSVMAGAKVHRRAIRVDLKSFIVPRG